MQEVKSMVADAGSVGERSMATYAPLLYILDMRWEIYRNKAPTALYRLPKYDGDSRLFEEMKSLVSSQ